MISKPTMTNWAHDSGFVITKDLFPELSKFLANLNWNVISTMKAPENTPGIGFVFVRLKDYSSGRFSTKPSFLRAVETNLSFLVWNALMTCKQVLQSFNRRRLNWELLHATLTSSVNAAYAAVGGIEVAAANDSSSSSSSSSGGAGGEKRSQPATSKTAAPAKKRAKKAAPAVATESAGDVPISSQQPIAQQPVASE